MHVYTLILYKYAISITVTRRANIARSNIYCSLDLFVSMISFLYFLSPMLHVCMYSILFYGYLIFVWLSLLNTGVDVCELYHSIASTYNSVGCLSYCVQCVVLTGDTSIIDLQMARHAEIWNLDTTVATSTHRAVARRWRGRTARCSGTTTWW